MQLGQMKQFCDSCVTENLPVGSQKTPPLKHRKVFREFQSNSKRAPTLILLGRSSLEKNEQGRDMLTLKSLGGRSSWTRFKLD